MTTVSGVRLWYELRGEGEPMVLLGGGMGRHNLDPLIPYLEKRFQLLVYDMRGYGESDRLRGDEVGYDDWADDAAALLDVVGWEKAHFNGTALGGSVAIALGRRHPDRCRSLIIHGCAAKLDVGHTYLMRAKEQHGRLTGKVDLTIARLVAATMVGHDFLDEHPEFAEEVILKNLQSIPFETWLAVMSAMCDVDQSGGLTDCQVPALIITGEHAQHFLDLAPSGVGLRKIAELLANGRLVLLEGVGHMTIYERTQEHAEAIIAFTDSLNRQPSTDAACAPT